jgi:dihydroxyacetone kinase
MPVLDGEMTRKLTITALSDAVARAHAAMGSLESELNRADAHLGDGDTGTMLARLIAAFAQTDISTSADLRTAFFTYARAGSSVTGSSLGTLVLTGLMAAGKAAGDASTLPASDISRLLIAARDAAMARGRTELGQKTILDALDAVAAAIEHAAAKTQIAPAAQRACVEVLDCFREKPCQVGRARLYAEKSRGLDDPGMLAFCRLTSVIAEGAGADENDAP